jgi:hypothetical protein
VTETGKHALLCRLFRNSTEEEMSMSSHLTELRRKHQALSEIIETEQRRPASDDLDIKQLKLQKLHLKEEIERIATQV